MIILALAALAVAWLVMLLLGGMELDRGLLILAYAGNHPDLVRLARTLTLLGEPYVLIPLSCAGALVLAARRQWRSGVLLLATTLSGRLLVVLQKDWAARVRPDANMRLVEASSASFPSGHAANTTLVLLALALLLPRGSQLRNAAAWAAVWLSLAVGASRVMLGVHWPSDVIAGWAFGLFWTLLCLRLAGPLFAPGTIPPAAHSSAATDNGHV
jgi:undecaprenyl-diphosphatase